MFSRDATVAGRYLLLYSPKYEQQRGDLIRNGLRQAYACSQRVCRFAVAFLSDLEQQLTRPKRAISISRAQIGNVYDQTFKCYWEVRLKEYIRQTEGLQGNNWLHKMSPDRKTLLIDWYLVGIR
jgi:hypothetical protein